MTSNMIAGSRSPGQVAGIAPSADEVRTARRGRRVAFAIYGIPLLLLMIGMYVRLFASADRLDLGFFGYVFPLIVVAVLASLLWALVVEPYSRGNSLGDHLSAQMAVDAETVDKDLELLDRGREAVREARRQADIARTALLSADEEVSEMADLGRRGLQIAHAALGVSTVTPVRVENLSAPSYPQRDRIEGAVDVELARTERDAVELEEPVLPELESHDSPHLVYAAPPSVEPDLGFVVPTSIASYPESTLALPSAGSGDEPSHSGARWGIITAVVLGLVAAIGGGIWYGQNMSDAAVTSTVAVAEPKVAASDTALKEGRDYSFGARTAAGELVRWSCNQPITVRIAGKAPAGADKTVAGAVQAMKQATGLPLTMGKPLAQPILDADKVAANEIVYNYVTKAQIASAKLDLTGDKLGKGGPRYDNNGRIRSGWVAIRTDVPNTGPTTAAGRMTAWHEGAHTLNLGHSAEGHPELMQPTEDPNLALAWGAGDKFALAKVGC